MRALGFSLLQLLFALLILAILLALAVPNFKPFIDRQRLRDAVTELDSLYRRARFDAVRNTTSTTFSFTPSSGGLSWSATATDSSGTIATLPSSRFACVLTCSSTTSVTLSANRGIPTNTSNASFTVISPACTQSTSQGSLYNQACAGSSSAMTSLCAQNPGGITITIWPTGQSSVDKSQCPGA
jgi:Tfp pilus assembly protein FimT